MPQIEKGAPQKGTGPPQTELGIRLRQLAETAFADKGEWFSIETPKDAISSSIHGAIHSSITRLVAEISTKNGRIWILFYKDSDASE